VARRQGGSALVQLALALPVFLFVLVGTFQFLLTLHAQQVALGAAENGARLAAVRGAPADIGRQRTEELMRAGLGKLGSKAQVTAGDQDDVVLVDVTLQLEPLAPLTDRFGLTTVHAQGRANRAMFRPGGGAGP
jgi:Flp pilus assembly protein TadG